MKVLQINCVYEKGSTGKITKDIHEYLLENSVESVVIFGRGEKAEDRGVYKICSEVYAKANNLLSRFTGVMYGGCFFSTVKLIQKIKKENPDIVHLQCINGYFVNIYRLLLWLKKNKVKTVLTLHAEFMYTGNCSHALECNKWLSGCGKCPRFKDETRSLFFDNTAYAHRKMKKAFENFTDITIVSVSPWLFERAKRSPVLKNCSHLVILNGVDTEIFRFSPNSKLRKKYAEGEEKVIFHATAEFSPDKEHLKGGFYVLELAKKMKDVKFLVAGKRTKDFSCPENLIYVGNITDPKELAKLYSLADLTLLTSKKETFSMVCAESLCCGTAVAGFEAGAPEMISLPDHSAFVPHGNLEKLLFEAEKLMNRQGVKNSKTAQKAKKTYDKNIMAENYLRLYRSML